METLKTKPQQIQNPILLAFRLDEVAWREEAKPVRLREIFADDLMRTLWLAIKSRHITSQYFNEEIASAAASIRLTPPTDPIDLHCRIERMTGQHYDDRATPRAPDGFCQELFRYVMSVLDNGDYRLEYREQPKPQAAS